MQALYEYFWNDFCDWYVEATKLSFKNGDDAEKDRAASVLLNVMEESLRLLHPCIPFVTEEIYGKLPLSEIAENRKKAGEQKKIQLMQTFLLMLHIQRFRKEGTTRKLQSALKCSRSSSAISVDLGLNAGLILHQNFTLQ